MKFDVLYFDKNSGEKEKITVSAYTTTGAIDAAAKANGLDHYTMREYIFDIRRVKENGKSDN